MKKTIEELEEELKNKDSEMESILKNKDEILSEKKSQSSKMKELEIENKELLKYKDEQEIIKTNKNLKNEQLKKYKEMKGNENKFDDFVKIAGSDMSKWDNIMNTHSGSFKLQSTTYTNEHLFDKKEVVKSDKRKNIKTDRGNYSTLSS